MLIKGNRAGRLHGKARPCLCLISLITADYLPQIACCQIAKSIIKTSSTTDHYTVGAAMAVSLLNRVPLRGRVSPHADNEA